MLKSRTKSALLFFRYAILPVFTFSTVVGALVGVVVTLYNYTATILTDVSIRMYAFVTNNLWSLPLLITGLIAVALIIALLLKITPECKGSGIPRTEGVVRGLLTFRWLRVFLTTIINTFLAFIAGMSLGTEGPSIQLGATIADGITSRPYLRSMWRRHILTGGAAAGFAVAFNAPLTGIIFALEELHRKISPYLLFITALTVVVATSISRVLGSALDMPTVLFSVGAMNELPLADIWSMLLLGLAIGTTACVFNILITRSDRLISLIKYLPRSIKLIITLLITGALALWIPTTIGSGHELIIATADMQYSIGTISALFIIKLILVALCFNSGATGGLFLPMLTLGALVGGLIGEACVAMGLNPIFYTGIVVVGMAAFVGASTRAPITAMVLIVEITGQYSGFLMTAIAIIIACIIPHIFRIQPLYESLLNKISDKETPHEPPLYNDIVR